VHAVPLRDSLPDQEMTSDGGGAGVEQLLLVEDDEAMVRALECYFTTLGLQVVSAATIATAKRYYHGRGRWALVISDYHLPDGNGWEFRCWIREQGPVGPPFLLVSGAAAAAAYANQVSFLAKPFSVSQLDRHVEDLLGAGYRRSAQSNRVTP
jgi:DNA-binding NtrC family response regulator